MWRHRDEAPQGVAPGFLPGDPHQVDEQTSMSWAMVLIGSAAVVSGIVGYLLPRSERLSVALPLLIGAGVGVVALFLQAVGGGKVRVVKDPIFVGSDGGLAIAVDAPDSDWERLSA